jgi:hypothetical protein
MTIAFVLRKLPFCGIGAVFAKQNRYRTDSESHKTRSYLFYIQALVLYHKNIYLSMDEKAN